MTDIQPIHIEWDDAEHVWTYCCGDKSGTLKTKGDAYAAADEAWELFPECSCHQVLEGRYTREIIG